MVPVGYISAITFEAGLVGLFHGIFAGCVVSLASLSVRFHLLARRDMRRMGFVDTGS
jgi:Na+-driven multidrug efflux pump